MEILYDMTFTQSVNGGGESAIELLKLLIKSNVHIICGFDKKREITEELRQICNHENVTMIYFNGSDEFSRIVNSDNQIDTVVIPVCSVYYHHGLKINNNVRLITIVHDLDAVYSDECIKYQEVIEPDFISYFKMFLKKYVFRNYLKRKHIKQLNQVLNLNRRQTIVTVSNYSKYAMAAYYGSNMLKKIKVFSSSNINHEISNGNLKLFENKNKIKPDCFFLLVSGSRPHKNNKFAISTLDYMFSNNLLNRKFKVVLTGLDRNHIRYYKKHIANREQFVLTEYVDIDILEGLYRDEFALIYPSLYEGFGFPAVYAMKYGKNIISTSWTSLPEVCGDVAYYFNPIDEESLIAAILNCLEHPVDQGKILKRYSYVHAKQLDDCQKLATEILNYYE